MILLVNLEILLYLLFILPKKYQKKSYYLQLLIIYLEPFNLLEGFSFRRTVVYLYAGATEET